MAEAKSENPVVALLRKQAEVHRKTATGYRKDAALSQGNAQKYEEEAAEYRQAAKRLGAKFQKPEGSLYRRGPMFMMESNAERCALAAKQAREEADRKRKHAVEEDEVAQKIEDSLAVLAAGSSSTVADPAGQEESNA